MNTLVFVITCCIVFNFLGTEGANPPTLSYYQNTYKVKNITDADILTTTYYQIYYNYTATDIHVGIVVDCGATTCWAGWGISVREGLMVGSDAALGWVHPNGSVFIDDFTLQGQLPPDTPCVSGNICPDQLFSSSCQNNVVVRSGSREGTYIILEFSRPLVASDSCDNPIDPIIPQFVIVSAGTIDVPDFELYGFTFPFFILQHTWRGSEHITLSSPPTTGNVPTSEANQSFRTSLLFIATFFVIILIL